MRTEKQKLANWTELVHPGENVEIEKGVISASGSGGSGGGGLFYITLIKEDGEYSIDKTKSDIDSAINSGLIPVLIYDENGYFLYPNFISVEDNFFGVSYATVVFSTKTSSTLTLINYAYDMYDEGEGLVVENNSDSVSIPLNSPGD